jgi:hypothetical protein
VLHNCGNNALYREKAYGRMFLVVISISMKLELDMLLIRIVQKGIF